jgi:hypothetical protein
MSDLKVSVWDAVTYEDALVGAEVTLSAAGAADVVKALKAGTTSVTFDITGLGEVSLTTTFADYTTDTRTFNSQDCETAKCRGSEMRIPIFMSPNLMGDCGEVRGVLSWGPDPADLDSWLVIDDVDVGISCSSGCQLTSDPCVYYGAKKCEDEETKITLDVDVTTGEGPETITLHKLNPGRYKYVVHKYSGSKDIATSSAVLRIYMGSDQAVECTPPPGCTGDHWTVFDFVLDASGSLTMEDPKPALGKAGACEGGCAGPKSCTGYVTGAGGDDAGNSAFAASALLALASWL